jgi:hypothetical protein
MEIQEEEEGRREPVVSGLCLLSDLCARWGVGTLRVVLQSQVDGDLCGVILRKNACIGSMACIHPFTYPATLS